MYWKFNGFNRPPLTRSEPRAKLVAAEVALALLVLPATNPVGGAGAAAAVALVLALLRCAKM